MNINEKLFTIAADHLMAQGVRSVKSTAGSTTGMYHNSSCAYRGDNGTKCAIGCLIKDEFYSPGFENKTVVVDEVFEAVRKSCDPKPGETLDLELLDALQHIPDTYLPKDWRANLCQIASRFKYDWSPK